MRLVNLLLFVVILAVGFVLSILNSAPIKINYYYGWLEIPLSFALLGAFITGALIGLSSKIWSSLVWRKRYGKLSKQAAISKKEVSSLRTYPTKHIN
ncbi:MAG TPA: LapA family protein [Cycloclasticus sp.]|nr:LapA family protein [Cycloclasticus sp.]